VERDGAHTSQIHDGGGDDFPYTPPMAISAPTAARSVTQAVAASPTIVSAPAAARSTMEAATASPAAVSAPVAARSVTQAVAASPMPLHHQRCWCPVAQ
jgi:hypothetical protein